MSAGIGDALAFLPTPPDYLKKKIAHAAEQPRPDVKAARRHGLKVRLNLILRSLSATTSRRRTNHSSHKGPRVRELIEAAAASVLSTCRLVIINALIGAPRGGTERECRAEPCRNRPFINRNFYCRCDSLA